MVVGIPAYDEEKTIAKVVVRAFRHADKVLVFDDGSDDDTAMIAERLGAIVVRHEKNLGKGAALRGCLDLARKWHADVLVTLDADGQHDPEDIPSLIRPILEGQAEVVIGSRRYGKEMPAFRRFGARFLDRATGVRAGGEIVDAQSGFRAYSKKALGKVTAAEYGMGVDSQILMSAKEAGLRIVEIPVGVKYGQLDTSTHNPFYHTLDVFFSVLKFVSIRHPLRFYMSFAAIMFVVSVVFGILTLDYYSRWGRVITNLALISISAALLAFLSLFTGIILFTLISVLRERS